VLHPNELEWVLLQRKLMIRDRVDADAQRRIMRKEMALLQARRAANGWNDTVFDQVVQQNRDYQEALGDNQFFAASAASRASLIRCVLGVDEYMESVDPEVLAMVRANVERQG